MQQGGSGVDVVEFVAARESRAVSIVRWDGVDARACNDTLATEEPLEIQLEYGPRDGRGVKSISVTMRTPGHDKELVAGFLLTEGVLYDPADIEGISSAEDGRRRSQDDSQSASGLGSGRNVVRVSLAPGVRFNMASLERNFYTTSSCGICGKASLLALRSVSPPRSVNTLRVAAEMLYGLPERLRAAQPVFDRTGGLHACGLFDADGNLLVLREDVGRHNACDKVLGHEFLADRAPLRNRILLLSGRASFELLQKSVMAGVPMVASVGAPSSLAVEVAREFDVTLIGFLRGQGFNVYQGAERVVTACHGGIAE